VPSPRSRQVGLELLGAAALIGHPGGGAITIGVACALGGCGSVSLSFLGGRRSLVSLGRRVVANRHADRRASSSSRPTRAAAAPAAASVHI
jgi:hypothetical protein